MPMTLSYTAEAEAFRLEVRSWLEDNLPEGWGSAGFEMSAEDPEAGAKLLATWIDSLTSCN